MGWKSAIHISRRFPSLLKEYWVNDALTYLGKEISCRLLRRMKWCSSDCFVFVRGVSLEFLRWGKNSNLRLYRTKEHFTNVFNWSTEPFLIKKFSSFQFLTKDGISGWSTNVHLRKRLVFVFKAFEHMQKSCVSVSSIFSELSIDVKDLYSSSRLSRWLSLEIFVVEKQWKYLWNYCLWTKKEKDH